MLTLLDFIWLHLTLAGFGRLWLALVGFGWLWLALAGIGRLWLALAAAAAAAAFDPPCIVPCLLKQQGTKNIDLT